MKTLSEIAALINVEYRGDKGCNLRGLATLTTAGAGDVSFMANPHYRKYLATTQASAVILSPEDLPHYDGNALITRNPYLAYAKVAQLFAQPPSTVPGIHPTAVIGTQCRIAATASVGPYCVIGDSVVIGEHVRISPGCIIDNGVHIGDHSLLWAHVTLYRGVHLGERVIVHSGTVIGSDGFGFAENKGQWEKIPQLGSVIIGNDVEIGANTSIDRGALDNTIIEQGVKIDNQVQIGHNVYIGAHSAIAGCVGISGSARIGKYCRLGGGSGIGGHMEIADGTVITGMTGVRHSVKTPGIYSSGTGFYEHSHWQKIMARLSNLDDWVRRLKKLEKSVIKEGGE